MADKKISQLTSASTPLAGTEVLPMVQSGSTVKVASNDLTVKNVRSNATTGILQVAGPAAGATRTMTVPDANFTAARTDAAQTFTGSQTFSNGVFVPSSVVHVGETTAGMYVDVYNGTADAQRVRITMSGTDGLIRATRSSGTTPNLLFQIDSTEYFKIGNTGNVTVNNGNLVVGTAAKGIDFSANSGNVLTQYKTGSHTPTWTATSVNPVLGNGTLIGSYVQIGSNCMFQFSLTMGSTTTFGTGEWEFTAPFTASKTGVGSVWALDSGTAYYIGAAKIEATSNKIYIWTNAGVTGWSATAPFTWAADDRIEVGISFTV
jgi:hypothetical protein